MADHSYISPKEEQETISNAEATTRIKFQDPETLASRKNLLLELEFYLISKGQQYRSEQSSIFEITGQIGGNLAFFYFIGLFFIRPLLKSELLYT